MADSKVTALTELTTPQPTDELMCIDNSGAAVSKRVSRKNNAGYTEYVALITQAGAGAPTAVEIKNDTGATVAWSRLLQGMYTGTFSSSVLTADKTACMIFPGASEFLSCTRAAATSVTVLSYNTAWGLTDGLMTSILVIIRIYV